MRYGIYIHLDVIDKLAHALKNLDKIIASKDGEYARRKMAKRSRSDDKIIDGLRKMMRETDDEHVLEEMEKMVERLENA